MAIIILTIGIIIALLPFSFKQKVSLYENLSISEKIKEIPAIEYLRITQQNKVSRVNLFISAIFGVIITVKAPVAISIYFITTSLFGLFEEISFRIYIKKKCFS